MPKTSGYGGKLSGSSRMVKSRGRTKKTTRGRLRMFDDPLLNKRRAAHQPLPRPVEAGDLVARTDQDWMDDERCIHALGNTLGVSVRLRNGSADHIELERLWKLAARSPAGEKWRRRAWYYRRILILLAQKYISGFERIPTVGETKKAKWTPSSLHYLAEIVHTLRVKNYTDTDALKFLLTDNPRRPGIPFFKSDMTFANAKKLLQRARKLGKFPRLNKGD